MLKYAFTSCSCPELDLEELLQVARWYGYQGVEPHLETDHAHALTPALPAERRRHYREVAQAKEVAICCLSLSTRLLSFDSAQAVADCLRPYIDLAGDLGALALRLLSGDPPAGVTGAAADVLLAERLRAAADHAQAAGVTLYLETHDAWCHPLQVRAAMALADHPAVAVNWDLLQTARTGVSVAETFEALRPWLRHVHAHDAVVQGEGLEWRPLGQGEIDHAPLLRLLAANDYQGYVCGEWINWEPWEIHLPRELAKMRQYERSIAEE